MTHVVRCGFSLWTGRAGIGVHVVGEYATEIVHIGLIAMLASASAEIFDRVCFNYPTLGDLYKSAACAAFLRRSSHP